MRWFFLNRYSLQILIKLNHTITFGISNRVGKYGRAANIIKATDQLAKAGTIKYIVAQNQGYFVLPDKLLTDHKCLCQSVRFFLYSVSKTAAKFFPIAEQPLKTFYIFRCGDDQN